MKLLEIKKKINGSKPESTIEKMTYYSDRLTGVLEMILNDIIREKSGSLTDFSFLDICDASETVGDSFDIVTDDVHDIISNLYDMADTLTGNSGNGKAYKGKLQYRNYMVIDKSDEWMLACYDNFEEAKRFADSYISREDDPIAIWATDEEPDCFKFCDEIYNTKEEN